MSRCLYGAEGCLGTISSLSRVAPETRRAWHERGLLSPWLRELYFPGDGRLPPAPVD